MDAELQNGGARTNHDRDYSRVNGVNGEIQNQADIHPEKTKGPEDAKRSSMALINGGHDGSMDPVQQQQTPAESSSPRPLRMNDLPDEIQHISQNLIPVSLLLTRLAQKSHNNLQDGIFQMAKMALPPGAVNGNVDTHSAVDDTSPENLEKKKLFLHLCQSEHTNWVKALVITEWSKKAEQVSKLIDINMHMTEERRLFEDVLEQMTVMKRDLAFARLPGPDLKTALQVLSHGTAPYMPELEYVVPPPLTPQERLKWMDNIDTLLSIRLNLDDHDKIPYHFQDYDIDSGRVTFKVRGEFEVDLTIADEDFEKQFWFIDFRFLCSPAPKELSDPLRAFLEGKVNDALAVDSLTGCYNVLHEYVLTHKIHELRRQAVALRRGPWIDTLKVEQLDRAMSIQYWASRYLANGPKSWIIVGVHSGKRRGVAPHPKHTSYLYARWFRDNKEVKDAEIGIDAANISAEAILETVIAHHIRHILSAMHSKLLEKRRFAKRQAAMGLRLSGEHPSEYRLEVQLTALDVLTFRIDPFTGFYSLHPHSHVVARGEHRLNAGTKDAAEEGLNALDAIRCMFAMEEIKRRGKSAGWSGSRNIIPVDELRQILHTRDPFQTVWLKRQGWDAKWQIMVALSMSGDRWFLVELTNNQSGPRINMSVDLPLSSGEPNLAEPFFSDLTTFVAGIISHISDKKAVGLNKREAALLAYPNPYLPPRIKIPSIKLRLSHILASQGAVTAGENKRKTPWAAEYCTILFKGVEETSKTRGPADSRLGVVAEARLSVTDRKRFTLLKGKVDHDVAFNTRSGEFQLRLRAEVGRTVIETLEDRLRAIERLVGFLDAIRKQSDGLSLETATLRKLVFTYGDLVTAEPATAPAAPTAAKRWKAILDFAGGDTVRVQLEAGNPQLRIIDFLTSAANDARSYLALPFYFTTTLGLQRALDRLEDSWADLAQRGAGLLTVFAKALDWTTVRFVIQGADGLPRRLHLDIHLRARRGAVFWHVSRSYPPPQQQPAEDDDFDRALKRVWEANNQPWKSLNRSAAADPIKGIEPCLAAVDEAVRHLAGGGGGVPQGQAAPRQQQQQQQAGGGRAAMSQGGGGGNPRAKGPVVDLTSK